MKITDFLNNSSIQLIGRTYIKDEALHMNFSGSGIRFCASGKIKVNFKSKGFSDKLRCPHICILVDGVVNRYYLEEEYMEINLDLGLDKHIVDIIKNSESPVSQTAITEIEVDNIFEYNHPQKYKLEFYGDSLTCGYGVLSDNAEDPFTSITESFVDGYAYLTSQNLNCDYSLVSVSGFPVYKSRWNLGFPIDSVADMISFSDYEEPYTMKDVIPWDNSLYKPGMVIINLGTNDESYFTPGTPWIDELVEKHGSFDEVRNLKVYKDELSNLRLRIIKFLDDLFSNYGDIKVVYATGLLKIFEDVNNVINDTIKEYAKTTNKKVYRYEFKVQKRFDKRGASYHPGKEMHKFAAAELASFIFDIM